MLSTGRRLEMAEPIALEWRTEYQVTNLQAYYLQLFCIVLYRDVIDRNRKDLFSNRSPHVLCEVLKHFLTRNLDD
jgi:hypothetical protein